MPKGGRRRTRKRGGVKTPPRKKTQPNVSKPISPPRKTYNAEKYIPADNLPKVIETVTTYEKTNPQELMMKPRGPLRKIPQSQKSKLKAVSRKHRDKMRTAQKVFQRPRGGMRRTRRRRRKKSSRRKGKSRRRMRGKTRRKRKR
tara:strand:- start:3354 stop:3785 length:432 start_codon:yes stop_codon:yes gene_type:complete